MRPMDCDKALFHAREFAEGRLTVWRHLAISRHLEDCPGCRQGYNVQIHYRQVITTKCQEQVPADLQARIIEALGCGGPTLEQGLPLDPDRQW